MNASWLRLQYAGIFVEIMYAESETTTPKRTLPRSLYWPGFVLGMLIASALSCGGLYLTTGLSDITLADIRGGAPAWVPPTPVPAVEAADDSASDDSAVEREIAGAFRIGQTVRNIHGRSMLNIRATPGYLNKTDTIAQAWPGESMEILDGMREVDGLRWWLIRYVDSNGAATEGWVAEATASGVKLLGE